MPAKIIQLNTTGTQTEDLLHELLDKQRSGDLTGLIICATVKSKNPDGRTAYGVRRWFFDEERLCTSILGLWEYTKQYMVDYMRNEDGYL